MQNIDNYLIVAIEIDANLSILFVSQKILICLFPLVLVKTRLRQV